MRYYISFILFSLFAVTFSSCNTDDLEKDIDALKDRVTSFETQVQQLNDEMNIIRVALDGNKTITDYSINGDTYTLTLSNGETLTLTPGVVGGNYPSIEIGENGNWVIGGVDTGWRAEAKDGEGSTITPKFKIEANPADEGKKYWWVSYDEGTTWSILVNGLAEGVNTNTNPISGAEVVGDNFKVTINNQDYFIPIVKNLVCAINLPQGVVTDGLWSVASGGASTFTVKVNLADGDLVRVNAPVNWNAKLSNYGTGTTEITVTVTPPATPSECAIVVEVTHGVNTAVDQIKARTTSDSYWAEYNAGFDITIGDVVINKYDYPDGQLLLNGATVPVSGLYFIAENATVARSGGVSDLVLVAEKKNNDYSSKIKTQGIVSLGHQNTGVGFLCKNIFLSPEALGTNGYWFNLSNNIIARLYFDHCKIELMQDKAFSFFNNTSSGIGHLLISSCHIAIPATASSASSINFLNYAKGDYVSAKIYNNVFYCSTADCSVLFAGMVGESVVSEGVNVENNTLLNVLTNQGGGSGFFRSTVKDGWAMKNNLFWYDVVSLPSGGSKLVTLMSSLAVGTAFDNANFTGNNVFSKQNAPVLEWKIFRTSPTGFKENVITVVEETPFVEDTFIDYEGKYTLKPEYQGIGATIN